MNQVLEHEINTDRSVKAAEIALRQMLEVIGKGNEKRAQTSMALT